MLDAVQIQLLSSLVLKDVLYIFRIASHIKGRKPYNKKIKSPERVTFHVFCNNFCLKTRASYENTVKQKVLYWLNLFFLLLFIYFLFIYSFFIMLFFFLLFVDILNKNPLKHQENTVREKKIEIQI